MAHKYTMSILPILLTLNIVIATQITEDHIRLLRKRSIITTIGEKFHVVNMTFPCNQTDQLSLKDHVRELLDRNEEILIRRVERLSEEEMKNIMKYKGGSMMPEYLANNEETVHRLPDAKAMRFNAKIFIGNSRGAFRSQALERNGQLLNAERKLEANALSMKQKLQKQTAFTDSTDFGGNFFSNNRILERKKRETLVDWNCSEAGETTEVDADYVHLCKICSGKRYLPVDRYPRYVNEVRCSATENSCLGNNNGKCVETQFNAHLLKRKVGECRLCVKETEVLAVDEWEVYIEPIRVGCECILNKKSNYRQQWFSAGSN